MSVVKRETPQDRGASRDPDDDIPTCWYSDRTFESAPYHLCRSPEEVAEPFVLYITDKFGWEEFQDEVEDFGNVFGHRTAFVARFCMATVVYFEIACVRGYRWVFPNIPPEMERMTSRRGGPLPASPKESTRCNGVDLLERCLRRWRYFLALMQFWKDETMPFQYGGVVRYDSKVMLYCMFRIKAVLKSVSFHFHHYAVKGVTMWGEYARHNLMAEQITADRRVHQKTHDDLMHKKGWMQHRYEDEADLEFEVIKRVRGDVDRLEVHREDKRRHPGNEDEYCRFRQKMDEENRARGQPQTTFEQALAQQRERATRDQRRELESRERQRYAREREEQIDFEQSEPYPMLMSEPDPAQPEASSRGDTKPKAKISLEEYRDRQCLEQSQEQSAEAKVEQACMHKIKIQEQLHLEQERVQEQEDNAANQAQQVPATFGSHTPCYNKHGQELDYHDDVPVADSQGSLTWSDYFCQYHGEDGKHITEQLDAEHALLLANTPQCTRPPTVSEEAVLPKEVPPAADVPTTANPEWKGWGEFLHQHGDPTGVPTTNRLDVEQELLQGPTEPVTMTEEAVLLDEMPTLESEEAPTAVSKELTPTAESQETPATEGEIPTVDMRQFLVGLQTLTPENLTEISMHIDRLRQLAAPLASTKPSPPGLPATLTVSNPMEQALLKATSDLGTSPSHQRMPMHPPGAEETEHATTQLVEQMAKAPGTPARRLKHK